MNFNLRFLFDLFIIIPGIIGFLRFNKINKSYHPFIIFIWVGVLNEFVGHYSAVYFKTNTISYNIYGLIEALLIVYQFYKWNLFAGKVNIFKILICLLILFWIVDNFFIGRINDFNSNFTVAYYLLIVGMSIIFINRILAHESRDLLTNSDFIICSGFVVYFTYSIITEISWKHDSVFSISFSKKIHDIFTIINLLNNILFTYAILCMRRKIRFSIPY